MTKINVDQVLRYAELGYEVFPCVPQQKTPATEHGFKDATTDSAQIKSWWQDAPHANVGLATADLLVVDVDGADNPWLTDPKKVRDLQQGPTSSTPRGGRHHIFRQPEGRDWRCTTSKIGPKVDTRSLGGYIVVAPSVVGMKPYRWIAGRQLEVPVQDLPEPPTWLTTAMDGLSNGKGNIVPCTTPLNDSALRGGNTIPDGVRNSTLASLAGTMRRAGMPEPEISAALLVANQNRCRPPLSVYRIEAIVASICRYEPDHITVARVENHWAQNVASPPDDTTSALSDPGPVPTSLLRIPGFVSEVMDYCLATAPYPNPVMAFAGAIALQATLAGRKIRDPGDNRTNLYILGLAHSAAGKDRPRKLNSEILNAVGQADQIGGQFASGEGLQDALFSEPTMLFQTDEFDGMMLSMNKAKDARHESIMNTLLTLHSSANSVFPMRRKAGRDSGGVIDQPCLVVFGTAIPNHYYGALSERMLTNGFFSRTIVLECEKRLPGQEPRFLPIPENVLETARWWTEFAPKAGNLRNQHPEPLTVQHSSEAKAFLAEVRLEAEAEYAKAEAINDTMGTTVWGRVSEHTRKLALIYAISENLQSPEIGRAAVEWARSFVIHQTQRMLFMAQGHVADSPFQAECLKFLQKLRDAPRAELQHSVLLKRMKMPAKDFSALVDTLLERGDISKRSEATKGAPGTFYGLRDTGSSCGVTATVSRKERPETEGETC